MTEVRPRQESNRRRARGQAIVEFGLVALLFTLLLMGIVDFAILLNGWLGVSSTSRDLARQAAVGICPSAGWTDGSGSTLPSGTNKCAGTPYLPTPPSLVIQGLDRGGTSTLVASIKFCLPGQVGTCTGFSGGQLWNAYPGGLCASACEHPIINDTLVLTIVAPIQVVTPLVRPFFGCNGWWITVFTDDNNVTRGTPAHVTTSSNTRCDVPITSQAIFRYEGTYI